MGYVTLGLFTSALLDELLKIKKNPGATPEHTQVIKLTIDSLNAIKSPKAVDKQSLPDLVFQDYQEVSTLRKTLSSFSKSIDDIVKTLNDICITSDSEKRSKDVYDAILFFMELAHRSIINAECTEERVPPGVKLLGSK